MRRRKNVMLAKLKKHIKDEFNLVFHDDELLIEAFTHSSYANDHRKNEVKNLERLEFLGDAVVELCTSEYLYNKFPELPEGQLTRMRAASVREESLAQLTLECDLAQFIRLGKGEEMMNGRTRPALLCDVFEAFTGAIFQDLGMDEARRFISQVLFPRIDNDDFSHGMDFKTALQELMQRNGEVQINYQVINTTGPDHKREFTVEVTVEGDSYGIGVGNSKKRAEQQAAKKALEQLS